MRASSSRRRSWIPVVVGAVLFTGVAAANAKDRLDIRLSSYAEVPNSLSTPASGRFKGRIDEKDGSISYELSYSGIVEVRQAHIHLGRRALNGGIMVWLCQTALNPDPSNVAPLCPPSGSVSGTIRAANVVGPAGQGVTPGAFEALVDAIRANAAYVNVHSTAFPGGELRGQLRDDD